MQLPLSTSALVPVGVGAVLAGVLLILVILAARRRRPARGAATRGAALAPAVAGPQVAGIDAGVPPEPVGDAARHAPTPDTVPGPPDGTTACATSATDATDPTAPDAAAREPSPDTSEPTGPAVPVADAADPRSAAEPPAVAVRPALAWTSVDRRQAGPSRSVAAAVAQAFAVRAAASGAGAPMPTWGTNGARRQHGPDVPRDGSPAVDPRSNGVPARDRDGGNPVVREQPPRQVPQRAAAPSSEGGPEQTAEPEPAAGANDGRDTAEPTWAEEPGSELREQAPGSVNRPGPGLGTNGAGRAVPALTGAAAWTDGRGAVPPHHERVSDARDRLLAVLLADPGHTVGATEELVRCLRALECLTDAVRHEREVLGDVLRRLADDGLRSEQLARLAGMSIAEVEALLTPVQ